MATDLDLARSLVDGTLDWLCPRMELHSVGDSAQPILVGVGVLRSDGSGRLRFQMRGEVPHPLPVQLQQRVRPGQMLGLNDMVMLVATDMEGREWRSSPMPVRLNHPYEFIHGYFSREVDELTGVRRTHKQHPHATVLIPSAPDIPFDMSTQREKRAGDEVVSKGWSIDHHRRGIGSATVTFRKEDGWLTVVAEQESPFATFWPGIVCHALEFATAKSMNPALVMLGSDESEVVTLYPGPYQRLKTNLPPPVVGSDLKSAGCFWELVEKFTRFASEYFDDAEQVIDELAAIRAGAGLSVQTAHLTLAVGVEALARKVLPVVPPAGWNAPALQELLQYVENWTGDDATKSRVLGLLAAKAESRAIDRLYAWAGTTGVSEDMIKAWKELRNPSAHGAAFQLDQRRADRYFAVVELLHRIIAWKIGYQGPILETSQLGWGQGR